MTDSCDGQRISSHNVHTQSHPGNIRKNGDLCSVKIQDIGEGGEGISIMNNSEENKECDFAVCTIKEGPIKEGIRKLVLKSKMNLSL